jgi:hypothetical protein
MSKNDVRALLIVGAIVVMLCDREGWGWLLLLAVLV